MIEKLGKIKKVSFGYGGYQDVQICFTFELGGDGWGTTNVLECGWGHVSKAELADPKSTYKWTHEGRVQQLGEKAWKVFEYIRDAKVRTLQELEGVPVRVFFEGEFGRNHGFEILKEVR